MPDHPNAPSCHIDEWSAVLRIQFSTGLCPVTADWRGRKTTWGLLITCPWFNGWSLWFVCPAGASGQDSKIVSGWWTGKAPQDTFVMWDWGTTIRSCRYSLTFLMILVNKSAGTFVFFVIDGQLRKALFLLNRTEACGLICATAGVWFVSTELSSIKNDYSFIITSVLIVIIISGSGSGYSGVNKLLRFDLVKSQNIKNT